MFQKRSNKSRVLEGEDGAHMPSRSTAYIYLQRLLDHQRQFRIDPNDFELSTTNAVMVIQYWNPAFSNPSDQFGFLRIVPFF